MCATRRRLCSMSTLRASRSPAAKRSKYAFSSAAESGRGNEPGLPARRREKNRLLHKSQTAAESIYINSSPHPMSGQEVPMRMLCAAVFFAPAAAGATPPQRTHESHSPRPQHLTGAGAEERRRRSRPQGRASPPTAACRADGRGRGRGGGQGARGHEPH